MRKFEIISEKQFNNDVSDGMYSDIVLPIRKTSKSAGYDFISFKDVCINPGEIETLLDLPDGTLTTPNIVDISIQLKQNNK